MDESRRSRFKRLAIQRTNKIIKQLSILGNLSNKSYYDYGDLEVKKIFRAIDDQLRVTKSKFKSRRKKFKL